MNFTEFTEFPGSGRQEGSSPWRHNSSSFSAQTPFIRAAVGTNPCSYREDGPRGVKEGENRAGSSENKNNELFHHEISREKIVVNVNRLRRT